jgi:Ca2+-binding EF-hand superfamily protein
MATDASNADDARGARRPSDDALARAYELLDARGRGYFTARDVRRVADANGFADWSDARVRAMVSAFKPEVERRVTRDGADESSFRMSRVEFERAVARAGARAPRA